MAAVGAVVQVVAGVAAAGAAVYSATQTPDAAKTPAQQQTEKAPNANAFRNRAKSAPAPRGAGSTLLTGGGANTAGTTLLGA